MMYELKKLIQEYRIAVSLKLKTVTATVVALDGSSYRLPGVRMLIREDGKMMGAVSGGCVEKEILRQAQSVFKDNIAKVMTYDGRYRLGCEGILYILIEPFSPSENFLNTFDNALVKRESIHIQSYFSKEEYSGFKMCSVVNFPENKLHPFSGIDTFQVSESVPLDTFSQTLKPCYNLIIIGAEHDAVQLAAIAGLVGWEVTIVAPINDPRTLENFPGSNKIEHILPEQVATLPIDVQTAIILMTHSYVTDLKFLIALKDTKPAYIGLLGPSKRREKLLSEFMELTPDFDDDFFELIYGPSGLNIGAETPQEIALSILSEILSVIRKQKPMSLKDKKDRIHDGMSDIIYQSK